MRTMMRIEGGGKTREETWTVEVEVEDRLIKKQQQKKPIEIHTYKKGENVKESY